jgi:cardiolipin synthase A/B
VTRVQRVVVGVLLLAFVVAVVWALAQFARSLGDDGDGPPPRAERPTAVGRPPTPVPRAERPAPGEGVVGVFVEPDDGRAPILEELAAAEETIDLAVYLMTDPEIIAALEGAVARGVEVRVILEEQPFGGSGDNPEVFARLERAGARVRWSNPTFRFTHIKTFVIDDETAIVMNLNLTRSAFSRNREFGVITTRPAEVAQAAAIFEADWRRVGEPEPGPLVVSPTTSREELLGLLDGARETIDVYAEVVRDAEVMAALAAAEGRGVAVRLVMSAGPEGEDDNAEERRELAEAGVEVRLARGLYIHAKMVLVDGERAFVGSQNFTATSLDLNRELGIVLDDPANVARLAAVFAADFAAGRPEGG